VRKILLGSEPERAADANALANPGMLEAFSAFQLHKETASSQ
jgi:hypothetical protein